MRERLLSQRQVTRERHCCERLAMKTGVPAAPSQTAVPVGPCPAVTTERPSVQYAILEKIS